MDLLSSKTRADLGWDLLLSQLAARCHSDRGAQLCRDLSPLPSAEEAHARQAEVSEARALQDRGEPLPFGGVRDLREALGRAAKGGALLPPELVDVARTLMAGARLRRHVSSRAEHCQRLLSHAGGIAELVDVSGPIEDAFDETGALRDNASPALRGLRQRALALQEELSRRADGLLEQGHIAPYLQDRFVTQREERYVLPIRADARSRVRGIVHGQSASGATVFVEPEEVIDLNNRLKLAQLEVVDEERRILTELSARVQDAAPRISNNLVILAYLDLVDAGARLSVDLRGSPLTLLPQQAAAGAGAPAIDNRGAAAAPAIDNRGAAAAPAIDLRNARHPLLLLSGIKVVANDIRVPAGGTLVVSGPNAGGKTVALKCAGLCALMARSGLHCPVQEGSSMPLYDRVLTDVGDEQSLERSLSTFSAHILNLCEFLSKAQPGTLVLLDEVAAGTDPEQGSALAQALLEAFARAGATVVVTTHYDRLKSLATRDPRFVNASVGYDLDKLVPTYRLHLGVPGASGAVLVARRLGLPDAVANRANDLIGVSKSGVEELLQTLSREREALLNRAAQAEALRAQAERDLAAAAELRAEAQRELIKARRNAHDDAIASLRKARVELDEARSALRHKTEDKARPRVEVATDVAQLHKRVDQLARDVAAAAPAPVLPAGVTGRPLQAAELAVGARVFVNRLGGIGTVLSDVVRDKVVVQVGALKLNVELSELSAPGAGPPAGARASKARPEPPRERAGYTITMGNAGDEGAAARALGVRTAAATLDLRGERVDVALARAEKFVDAAIHEGITAVWLIHGHGTGALRAAVREHFSGAPGVNRQYPAAQQDGGDGVTVLDLG